MEGRGGFFGRVFSGNSGDTWVVKGPKRSLFIGSAPLSTFSSPSHWSPT